jgi:hypothetical protein
MLRPYCHHHHYSVVSFLIQSQWSVPLIFSLFWVFYHIRIITLDLNWFIPNSNVRSICYIKYIFWGIDGFVISKTLLSFVLAKSCCCTFEPSVSPFSLWVRYSFTLYHYSSLIHLTRFNKSLLTKKQCIWAIYSKKIGEPPLVLLLFIFCYNNWYSTCNSINFPDNVPKQVLLIPPQYLT